ncbi:MAG: VWA domain-containing protein [Candidatus Scalinduaceae bacterium]
MKNLSARHSINYSLIIGSIIFSLLFHINVFLFLSNKKVLNLRAFEEAIHARFEVITVSRERMELERMYKEYDSPEEVAVLKESPERLLKDIPYTELETLAPKTKRDSATKLEISTSDKIKSQLQKEMLEQVGRLSRKDTKFFNEVEKMTFKDDIEQVKVSEGKKVAIKELNIFQDHHNLSEMKISGFDKRLIGKKPQKKEIIDTIPINKLTPETIDTKISKIDVKHDIETMVSEEEPETIHKNKYEDLSTEVETKFTTFSYPGKEEGYFKITITPKKDSILPLISKDVLFVIDISGSISDSDIEEVKGAISNYLEMFNKGDRFNIIIFSTTSKQLFTNFQVINQGNINAAISFINFINLTTKNYLTNIYTVLKNIVKAIPTSERPCNIFFISDGKPTTGITDIQSIVKDLAIVRYPNISIFPVDIGGSGNRYFLDLLAFESRGVSWVKKEDKPGKIILEDFVWHYKNPILLNLEVNYCNLDEGKIYPKILPNLYRRQKIEIYGMCKVNEKVALRIVGNTRDRKRELFIMKTISKQGNGRPEIAQEWARRKVHFLVTKIVKQGRKEEWIMEIEKLRKEFSINIPYKVIYGKYWFVKLFKLW